MQWPGSGRHVGERGILRQPRFGRVEGLGTGERPQAPSTIWRSHEVRRRGRLRERGRVEATRAQCHHSFASDHDPSCTDLAAAGGAGAGGVLAAPWRERGRKRRIFSNFRELEPGISSTHLAGLRHKVGRRHGDAKWAAAPPLEEGSSRSRTAFSRGLREGGVERINWASGHLRARGNNRSSISKEFQAPRFALEVPPDEIGAQRSALVAVFGHTLLSLF